MASTTTSCRRFIFLVGVSFLLTIKAEIKNSTRTNSDASNVTVMYAKQGKTNFTEEYAKHSTITPPLEKTSHKALLGNKTPLTNSATKRVHIYSTISTSTAGNKLISNVSNTIGSNKLPLSNTTTTTVSISSTLPTVAQQTTSTNKSKSSFANSDGCKEDSVRALMICLIIIAVLVLLCTFLLLATVVLANKVSYLKGALQNKRHTRNNGDFLTISSSFWPNGSDKWKGSQLLKGPNLSMDDLPTDSGTTSKGHISKKIIDESIEKSKHEQEPGSNISLKGNDDS